MYSILDYIPVDTDINLNYVRIIRRFDVDNKRHKAVESE